MATVTPEEAFRLLGIPMNSDQSEVTKAFHELSRQHHPDTGSGTSELQVRLNAAREVASAFIADRKAPIPVQLQQSVLELERQQGMERAARQAKDFVGFAIHRRMRPFQQMKYVSLTSAGIAGAAGWFGDNLLPRISTYSDSPFVQYREDFKLIAISLAAISGICYFAVQRHTFLVEAFNDRLDTTENCAADLAEALSYENRDQVRQGDISVARKYPILPTPFYGLLGLDDFEKRRLLILKSLEYGFLENIGPRNVIQAENRMYKVTFQPSQFAPRPKAPEPPPSPMGLGAAIGAFSTTAVLATLLIALTLYLYPSGWAWVSGTFAGIVSFVCLIFALAELLPAIRRRSLNDGTNKRTYI